jgi:hypothetical protein
MARPVSTDPVSALRAGITEHGAWGEGKSIIATAGARTNTAYGQLDNGPDIVEDVVIPDGALLFVAYQALVKSSAAAGSAAIFVGSSQAKGTVEDGVPLVDIPETNIAGAYWSELSTSPRGLISNASNTSDSSFTSGEPQILAVGSLASGGVCIIDPRQTGTFDVSIQFKAASGSVSAKERKLWVWTQAFG